MIQTTTKEQFWRALLLLHSTPFLSAACSCISMSGPCDLGWNGGELVFSGTVTSKVGGEQPIGNGEFRLTDYEVHFVSTEVFRGAAPPGRETIVYTGYGGGDCGYPFVLGQRYLVYADHSQGRLTTSICSGTGPAGKLSATIGELRIVRDHGRPDDLFGNLGIGPRRVGFDDLIQVQPLNHIRVRVVGKAGSRFSATTDDQGAYAFRSLPPDKYVVQEELPPGLHRAEAPEAGQVTIDLRHKGSSGGGCRVSELPRPDGRISGRVVDSAGKGVSGFITLEPTDAAEAHWAFMRGGLPSEDLEQDGEFSLTALPPGRYRLVFHPKRGAMADFRQTLYWPDRAPNSPAEGLELQFGQHLDGVRFTVPFSGAR